MATLSITIPDNQAVEALNYASTALGYQSQIEQSPGALVPNPETKQQFVRRKIAEYVKGLIISGAVTQATLAAKQTAETTASALTVT